MALSSILDLNGGTHTVPMDVTETYWKITDTSTLHNGTLILQSGAKLQFDDQPDAGFTSLCSAITVTVNGTAENPAYIRSADLFPHHPWTLFPTTANMTATRCHFMGDTGEWANKWVDNNCTWGNEAYCTVGDVRALTGIDTEGASGVDDWRVEIFIKNAADLIDETTGRAWDERDATDEIHDWDGREYVKLNHWPITDLTTIEYRTGSNPDVWETKTFGAEEDYVATSMELSEGVVHILEAPPYQLQAIRVNYAHGAVETPYKIRRLCMLHAAIDTYKAATSPGTTNIYTNDIKSLQEEIAKYTASVGGTIGIYTGKLPPEKLRQGSRWEKLWL